MQGLFWIMDPNIALILFSQCLRLSDRSEEKNEHPTIDIKGISHCNGRRACHRGTDNEPARTAAVKLEPKTRGRESSAESRLERDHNFPKNAAGQSAYRRETFWPS